MSTKDKQQLAAKEGKEAIDTRLIICWMKIISFLRSKPRWLPLNVRLFPLKKYLGM